MAHLLIIAMAVGIFLHDLSPPAGVAPGAWLAAIVLAPLLLIGVALAWTCHRTARRVSVASVRRADRAITACRFLLLPWFAGMLAAGWLVWLRRVTGDPVVLDELLAMGPVLAAVAWSWWCYYPIDRRLRESSLIGRIDRGQPIYAVWSRRQFMLAQLRHQVLLVLVPLALILAWVEAVTKYARVESEAWASALLFAGAGAVFLVAPLMIRVIFDTAPLPPGEVRDRLMHLCRVHGVRVRQLLLWRTYGGMINAAVMGVISPVRYVMLSDALLDSFPREQVEAVMAHELAHVRKHHMFWLLGFAFAAGAACDAALARAFGDALTWSWPLIASASAAGLAWVGAFGWASRRIERQADAFAAAHLARERGLAAIDADAAATMVLALQRVADLNHLRVAQRSWRHGSIESRQDALRQLIGQPLSRHAADRAARTVHRATLLLAAAAAIAHLL